MLYVFESFWAWLLAALIIGAVVGWLTWSRERRESWFAGWAKWGAIGFVVGAVIALLWLFPGRWGLWLETALLSFFVYIVGCFVGGWLKSVLAIKTVARRSAVAPAAPITPPAAPPLADERKHKGTRPPGLASARGGVADDLKLISGVGHENERRLHGIGIWHFDQIAAWTPANVKWISSYFAFKGRIEREKWVKQAKALAAGKTSDFARRAEAGLVKTSRDDGSRGQRNIKRNKQKGARR